MPRFAVVLLLSFLSGCAVMHTVTGDAVFAPEPKPFVRGPNVPEPEPGEPPVEPLVQTTRVDDDELAPLPKASASKKKSTNVAAAPAKK